MSILSELKLSVTRRVNIGNYEHVEITASASVGRDNDDDTPEGLRERLLSEIASLMDEAYKDYLPARRRKTVDKSEDNNDYYR